MEAERCGNEGDRSDSKEAAGKGVGSLALLLPRTLIAWRAPNQPGSRAGSHNVRQLRYPPVEGGSVSVANRGGGNAGLVFRGTSLRRGSARGNSRLATHATLSGRSTLFFLH